MIKKQILIIVIAVSTAITAICSLFVPTLVVLMLGAGYLIYKIWNLNEIQEQNNAYQNQIHIQTCIYSVYASALRVLPKLSNLLDIEAPKAFSDLYSEPCVVSKKGVIFIRTRVRVKKNNPQDITTLPDVMRLIQNTVGQCLFCGDLNDIFYSPYGVDGTSLILIVENVMFEDGYLVIDWGILDNQEMYNYLCQLSKIINISLPSKADEDF